MRLHEIMGIEQNRKWGVCSLNDFRKVSLNYGKRYFRNADFFAVHIVPWLEA